MWLKRSMFNRSSCARVAGTTPLSRLFCNCSSEREASFPSSGGMGPVSRLCDRSRIRRLPSSAISGGMCPLKPVLIRRNPITRGGLPPRSTPGHSSSGLCADHDHPLRESQSGPARMGHTSSSRRQSAARPGLFCSTQDDAPACHLSVGTSGRSLDEPRSASGPYPSQGASAIRDSATFHNTSRPLSMFLPVRARARSSRSSSIGMERTADNRKIGAQTRRPRHTAIPVVRIRSRRTNFPAQYDA